ncbi:unnamed protein product [Brachionus calyciflorus]|uniref:PiggyBac transposable element-derived protein domain-containing protein n=1 Tax=Brachionus calyciflorus TaxID=104777 RepID=A0A814F3P2_9BILA|nr:unnamed protein product [Brachionus calyciflorus]
MPNKPDKFGIKLWMLTEVESKYTLNGFPYLGKDCDRPNNKLKGCTLTVYQGRKEKNVVLFSTFHEKVFTIEDSEKLPNVIETYNKTKVGVDSVDYMTRLYSVKCKTRRWPLQVFFNILNLAGINSWVLFKKCNNYTLSRRFFLIGLGEEILKFINEKLQQLR